MKLPARAPVISAMTAPSPTLEWSQREPDIAVADVERLDRALDVIAEQCATDRPTIVNSEDGRRRMGLRAT
jgi:hypothetical protein